MNKEEKRKSVIKNALTAKEMDETEKRFLNQGTYLSLTEAVVFSKMVKNRS